MRAIIIASSLALAACAGPIETRIDSAGMSSVQPMAIQLDEAAEVEATSLVLAALEKKGFRQASPAQLNLQITVSDRPAALSLRSGSATLSPSSGKKRCARREYRLGITLTRIADGAEVYQGHAAEFHCKQTLQQVLPVLASAALADIGSPRGSYVVKRPRRSAVLPLPAG